MEGYKVLKVLGEGSFGRALLVHHKITDQKYAMKEIRLPMSSSDVENSRKEAILLAKMKHPNIVAYKESFEADGHLYIVMEYCDDGDLMQKIKHQRGKLFPEDMILHWFVQMCLGVKHIHDKRVLHRDIKSKNVFLTQNGKVKLGDFGSACLLAQYVDISTDLSVLRHMLARMWELLITYLQKYGRACHTTTKAIYGLWDAFCTSCALLHIHEVIWGLLSPAGARLVQDNCREVGTSIAFYGIKVIPEDGGKNIFQAKSWKHLILKICRGSYNPLPCHYSYELQYLIKQMFKRNPKDRPSASTILARSCLTKFIKNCLPPEVADEFKQTLKETRKHGGTTLRPQGSVAAGGSSNKKESKQSKDESSKHSNLKSENISKDLNKCTREQRKTDAEAETSEVLPGITDLSHPHRRKWEKRSFNTVVDVLENASLLSASFTSEEVKNGSVINYSEKKPRKQWNKETPQTLLNFLSNTDVSLAFKTYTIYKTASGNTLRGPLSDETEASDEVDGEHEAIVIDSERLEPRSDEDDTDFEEDDPDWVSELEMVLKHSD